MLTRGTQTRRPPTGILAGSAFALDQIHYLALNGFGTRQGLLGCGAAFALHLAPLLLGIFLAAFMADRLSRPVNSPPALGAIALGLGIVAVLGSQDLLQSSVLSGHPAALLSVGGWSAVPLAVLLGLVVAIVRRGVCAVAAVMTGHPREPFPRPRSTSGAKPVATVMSRPADVLATGFASRPPPLLA